MDFSDFKEKIALIIKQYWLPIGLAVIGLVFILYGLISSISHNNPDQDILAEGARDQAVVADATESKAKTLSLTVDIEGAVIKPGVYKLPKDARVQDVLIAAGGMGDRADREKVAKGLNLASKVVDGGKIYIPFAGESATVALSGGGTGVNSASSVQVNVMGDSTSSLININSASTTELDSLPGVGSVTAEKIISLRPYEKIEDLLSKKAVGASVFEKIKDKISVN